MRWDTKVGGGAQKSGPFPDRFEVDSQSRLLRRDREVIVFHTGVIVDHSD